MAIKIVFANSKGGVAKTTSVLNVSAFLSEMGYNTLCMDFDPQSNLTISFGIDILSLSKSLSEVFLKNSPVSDVIVPIYKNLSIVPAKPDLSKVPYSDTVTKHFKKNEIMKYRIEEINKNYDFIISDTASSKDVTNILTTNALSFSDYVIIPLNFEFFAVEGLAQMIQMVKDVRTQWLNEKIDILGALGVCYQGTKNHKQQLEKVKQTSASKYLFSSMISKNTDLSASVAKGVPITKYNKRCAGYRDYEQFTNELIHRLKSVSSER